MKSQQKTENFIKVYAARVLINVLVQLSLPSSTFRSEQYSTPLAQKRRSCTSSPWQDYVKDFVLSRSGVPPKHLLLIAENRYAWRFQLELLLRDPPRISRSKKDKYISLNNLLGLGEVEEYESSNVAKEGLFEGQTRLVASAPGSRIN